jgi:hypothetical protein
MKLEPIYFGSVDAVLFFLSNLCVQTGSGAHPVSCPMGTGAPFPGAKARPGRDTDHSPPSSAEVE